MISLLDDPATHERCLFCKRYKFSLVNNIANHEGCLSFKKVLGKTLSYLAY